MPKTVSDCFSVLPEFAAWRSLRNINVINNNNNNISGSEPVV